MRDLLLLGFIAILLATAIRFPFVGLLTWAWFTVMTPHQLAYDVFGLPLNMLIAAVTIGAFTYGGEIKNIRFGPISILIILFAGWLCLAQFFSYLPENSAIFHDRLMKTILFILLCIWGTTTKLRFHALTWTLVAGVGFYALKGGLFTLATLGEFRVQGLQNTILEDNNHAGIAIATMLPLLLYLREQSEAKWVRHGLLIWFALSIVAILGTHSRGAFLALVAFGGVYWLRANHKVTILAGCLVLLLPAIAFMPPKWIDRMTTITTASEDASFSGRVDAWVINYKLAKANPLTGVGLRNSYEEKIAETVDVDRSKTAKAAHSIYFEILGGAGFVGLAIYLSIFVATFWKAWSFSTYGHHKNIEPWISDFGFYGSISLIIFAVGGASTSMEMWDGYLLIIALIAASGNIVARDQAARKLDRLQMHGLQGMRGKHVQASNEGVLEAGPKKSYRISEKRRSGTRRPDRDKAANTRALRGSDLTPHRPR